MLISQLKHKFKKPAHDTRYRSFWQFIHIDVMLLTFIFMLCLAGLTILYSASSESSQTIEFQTMRMLFSFIVMFMIAQISPATLQRMAPWLYGVGLIMLVIVS